jgi:hypothetical protein
MPVQSDNQSSFKSLSLDDLEALLNYYTGVTDANKWKCLTREEI